MSAEILELAHQLFFLGRAGGGGGGGGGGIRKFRSMGYTLNLKL